MPRLSHIYSDASGQLLAKYTRLLNRAYRASLLSVLWSRVSWILVKGAMDLLTDPEPSQNMGIKYMKSSGKNHSPFLRNLIYAWERACLRSLSNMEAIMFFSVLMVSRIVEDSLSSIVTRTRAPLLTVRPANL